jgi:signal transduction histidine kinase
MAADDVLIVDDQPANLAVLARLLTDNGFRVRAVPSGERALEAAQAARPDCILLDVNMPGLDGFATCEALQKSPTLRHVPVIFLTAHDDLEHKVRGFRAGGRDYVTKPFQAEEVLARVRHQLRLFHLERELRERNEALADANARLGEAAGLKARMTAMLVHDLRSPLLVIGLVLDGDLDPEAVRDAAAAHAKMVQLTNEMLELSRVEQAQTRRLSGRVELGALLERVTRLSERLGASKGVAVRFHPPQGPLSIEGDDPQLDRVFTNLLDNALKFTPANGSVTVSLGVEPGEGVEAGLRFGAVRVVDTGPGIPPEDLPFVFDAYHQATAGKKQGGFGLGLAIVARIVSQHRGRIRTHSQLGVGTEFRVLLPLTGQ